MIKENKKENPIKENKEIEGKIDLLISEATDIKKAFGNISNEGQASIQPKPEPEEKPVFMSSFHGPALDFLSSMKNAKPILGDEKHIQLIKGDIKLVMPEGYSLGLNELKLLWNAVQIFTSTNTKGRDPSNLVVTFSLKEFAYLTGKDISTKSKRRDLSKNVKGYLENLKYINVSITKPQDEKGKYKYSADLDDCMIFQRVTKSDGQITFKFTEDYGSYLTHRPITLISPMIYKLENQNDLQLAINLNTHFSMDSNIKSGNFNKLKVSTMLTYVDLPSIKEVREKKRGWDFIIKTPLEEMLDRLTYKRFLRGYLPEDHPDHEKEKKWQWKYIRKDGTEIPAEDLILFSYEEWADTVIEYWITDFPLDKQKPRIAENTKKKKEARDQAIKNNVDKAIEKEKAYGAEMARLDFEARQGDPRAKKEEADAE